MRNKKNLVLTLILLGLLIEFKLIYLNTNND